MKLSRFERVIDAMQAHGVSQLIATDPVVIFYLTGHRIFPGERMLVLLVRSDRAHKLYVNDLFHVDPIPGIDIVYFNDIDDSVSLVCSSLTAGQPIAVDKNWPARFLLRLQELLPENKCINSSSIIDYVRLIKDAEEQQKMIRSSQINDTVMGRLIGAIGNGYDELQLNDLVRRFYKEAGCEGVSFDPITAFAKNAADPHHCADHTKGQPGDCVVLDIGGMKDDYASDMTRTVFLGSVSERQKEIYQVVLEANLRGIAAAKPGNRMCDVDLAARDYITSKGFGPYFTHRTGHSIGLEDHEFGDVSSVNTDIIREGQCFSVEPGIYIPEEGIGVRIEDLVLITKDGCQVLNAYPKDLTVITCE